MDAIAKKILVFAFILIVIGCKQNILEDKKGDLISNVPTGLTAETIRDPRFARIIDKRPEFSWIVPLGAKYQKAYQILVSSSQDLIDKNIGDIWDSGQVTDSKSINVEFGGEPLKPNTKYFWKVRVYGKKNRLSDYSAKQEFQTGAFSDKLTSGNYFQIEKIKPVKLEKRADSSLFVDFGKDAFATLELEYKSEEQKTLTIRLGEKLLEGKIDQNPGGTIRYQEVALEVTPDKIHYQIELIPDERNTNSMAIALSDSFPVIMPFRYAEIYGANDLEKEDIAQIAYYGYFDDNSSSFTSSDTILNQVWDLCKYSIKATSFAGYYVDGDRERIPYEADAYINQLSHYSVDNEYAIARKTIEYFMENPTWPTEWQLHVALMFYQDYMYTANTELVEKYYEQLKYKTLMDLVNEDGFISTWSSKLNGEVMANLGFKDTTQRVRDIIDWPPAQKDTGWPLPEDWPQGERDGFVFRPINTVINSFYYKNMLILAEFAHLLNKPDEELDFISRAEKVKKAINEKLFNKEKGFYRDGLGTDHGSVHANMLPLAFDIVPDENKKSVAEYIKTRGMGCSVYGAQYLMEAVYNAGSADYALGLMTATHDRSWYNMIKIGSTITLEAWDMRYKPNSDWNHAWGAAPANIIPRYLWGIKPKTPGFETIEIQPQMADLESCSIKAPTIRGEILGKYKRVNNQLTQYIIELPANMFGEFVAKNTLTNKTISLNGKNIDPTSGTIQLSPGENKIEILIDSFNN